MLHHRWLPCAGIHLLAVVAIARIDGHYRGFALVAVAAPMDLFASERPEAIGTQELSRGIKQLSNPPFVGG